MTKNLGKFDPDLYDHYKFKVRKRKGKWHVDSYGSWFDWPVGEVFDTRQQAVDWVKETHYKLERGYRKQHGMNATVHHAHIIRSKNHD